MLGTKKLPNIIFWIKPTQAEKWGNKKRQSDLYIYCWLKHKQAWSIDPIKLEQRTLNFRWESGRTKNDYPTISFETNAKRK